MVWSEASAKTTNTHIKEDKQVNSRHSVAAELTEEPRTALKQHNCRSSSNSTKRQVY
jgi:hypothetical protein